MNEQRQNNPFGLYLKKEDHFGKKGKKEKKVIIQNCSFKKGLISSWSMLFSVINTEVFCAHHICLIWWI